MSTESQPESATEPGPLLSVTDLVKRFPVKRDSLFGRVKGYVHAVEGVSFQVAKGETLGLVGESGCGKSTTGRAVLQLHKPTSGSVRFDGRELTTMSTADLRAVRRDMQIVFQDPYASLDPRWTINEIIAEPFHIHKVGERKEIDGRVQELLRLVGLNPEHRNRYGHEFSGGQRQRVGIARALALNPRLLILDEPVSALDVSVQAGVVNLLEDLQDQLGLAYVFIAHDLSVVRHISDRVAVMYLGKIVEIGARDDIYARAQHPYTVALLSAAPEPDPGVINAADDRIILTGDVPSPIDPPSGCHFRTRCWKAQDRCATEAPALVDRGAGHPVACHFPVEDVEREVQAAKEHRATSDEAVFAASASGSAGPGDPPADIGLTGGGAD
ncbi:ABC transporter ATP-binding protein [Nakamurella sp.]|uniref:ABC transporter ATP-binding protein n=1 Tax=Nakamurella sp. TaxID=1869182 RepID=UPI003783AFAD